jgi:hypothetical protein
MDPKVPPVALGFRSKTGRAILVALSGPVESPCLLVRREATLYSPQSPVTVLPYHRVMELPWDEAVVAIQTAESIIERLAIAAIGEILEELENRSHPVKAIGVVGSPDRDLTRIGNRHMRSHAAEGILFRRVLETAADRNGFAARSFSDRDIETVACEELSWSPPRFKEVMQILGRAAGPPWRSDERLAATAALLARRAH